MLVETVTAISLYCASAAGIAPAGKCVSQTLAATLSCTKAIDDIALHNGDVDNNLRLGEGKCLAVVILGRSS